MERPQSRHRHGQRPARPPRPAGPGASKPEKVKRPEKPTEEGEKKKGMSGGMKGMLIMLVLIILGGAGYFVYYMLNKKKVAKVEVVVKEEPKPAIKPEMKAIDISNYKMVQVEKGNYLYALSKELYGDPKYWTLIYKANFTKLDNPDFLPKMVELMVYEIDSSATSLTSEDSTMLSEAYQTVSIAYKKHGNDAQATSYGERAKEFVSVE